MQKNRLHEEGTTYDTYTSNTQVGLFANVSECLHAKLNSAGISKKYESQAIIKNMSDQIMAEFGSCTKICYNNVCMESL